MLREINIEKAFEAGRKAFDAALDAARGPFFRQYTMGMDSKAAFDGHCNAARMATFGADGFTPTAAETLEPATMATLVERARFRAQGKKVTNISRSLQTAFLDAFERDLSLFEPDFAAQVKRRTR